MGTLLGIATRTARKEPMNQHDSAEITFDKGVGTDSRGIFKGKRQVTVISKEAWDAVCSELDQDILWTTRRANLLVTGLDLENSAGKKIRIGNCLLEITGELEPCERMDEQVMGLTKVLIPAWRGGVCCRIVEAGAISINDSVEWAH